MPSRTAAAFSSDPDWVGVGQQVIQGILDRRNLVEGVKHNKEIAEFNRKIDLANLAIFMQRQRHELQLYAQRYKIATHTRDVAIESRRSAFSRQAYYAARSGIGQMVMGPNGMPKRDANGNPIFTRGGEGYLGYTSRMERSIMDREATIEREDVRMDVTLQNRMLHMGQMVDEQAETGDVARMEAAEGIYGQARTLMQAQHAEINQRERSMYALYAARGGREEATRTRIGTERAQLAETTGAVEAEIGIGRRQVGTRRRMARVQADQERQRTVEAARRGIGEAVAGGAARGVRGSGAQTQGAQIVTEMRRDLETQSLAAMDRDLGMMRELHALDTRSLTEGAGRLATGGARLDEQLAALGVETEERQQGLLQSEKAIKTQQAQANVAFAGAHGRFVDAREGVAQRRQERTQRANVREQQRAVQTRRGTVANTRYKIAADRMEMRRRLGLQEMAREKTQAMDAFTDVQRSRKMGAEGILRQQELNRQKWYFQAGGALAQWQQENMPDLPDYEGMQTRMTIQMMLNNFGALVG